MTTPVPIKKLLKEHLDELSEEELREFQWFLIELKKGPYQRITRSQLENATRTETVDKLVQVFGEDGAVETAVDTFSRIKRDDIVLKLYQANAERNTEQQMQEQSTIALDLSCPFCLDIFTDPVVLHCGHSFCRSCVHKSCTGEISPKCPICKTVVPHTEPPTNFALKSLSENYRERRGLKPSGGHNNESYQTPSKKVKEKQEAFEKVKQFCDSSVEQIKSQRCDTEKKIKDDFEELRDFLKTEEKTRLTALEEEERQKIRMMQLITEMSRDTLSLSDTVKEIEDLGAGNAFIQTFKTKMERTQNALPVPQQLPQALINVSRHVEDLQFRVCEKMLSFIKHSREVTVVDHTGGVLGVTEEVKDVQGKNFREQYKRIITAKEEEGEDDDDDIFA